MGENGFDEGRLWEMLGGIRADVTTIKANQGTLFGKIDEINKNGCGKGSEHDRELKRYNDRLVAVEQNARGEAVTSDSDNGRMNSTNRRHVIVAAGAGAGASGLFILFQMILDFILKLHGS